MSSLACNVVLLPGESLALKAIATSSQLTKEGVLFTLADGAFFPHVSAYMLQLKTDDLGRVQKMLTGIAQTTDKIALTAKKYETSMQFFDVEYEKTTAISELQNKVVAALNPIRDGMRAKDVERMQKATGLALENFQKYGWNTIGELYRPHMTLTRFTEDKDIAELDLPDVSCFSDTFPELGLFEMGDNGTCIRKIASLSLGTNDAANN